jgi:hypothetical protein
MTNRKSFKAQGEMKILSQCHSHRRGLMFMICSLILSPSMLLLYIWALRVGLSG